ncbi:SDR family oxidoreductase [Halobacteria archaeon AArc-m2/3/4]|uniref:SDR family oxidoreductase n=1 Tax=Natronoglomus mannanivorans TaxID=2979990 RepID=A0ABT2QKS3_9EURY|nr:SDR family oxidoreductase [Halobacteria archaeon AArc-m2/3/4]
MSDSHPNRFDQDVVLVTGSNYGIGKATVTRFAREGANVVVTGRDERRGRTVLEQLREEGTIAIHVPANLADPDAIETLIEKTVHKFGRIDVLVNNAAAQTHQTVKTTSIDEWVLTFDVNVRAYWLTVKHALPHMPDGSSIVNVSSNHAFETGAHSFPYNVTKAAINGLTRAMALEFGPSIRVNTLNSGWVTTDETTADDETIAERKEIADIHPAGRMGRPEDVAGAIAFLASDDAAFITGSHLLVDGGRSAVMYDRTTPDYRRSGWPEEYDHEWV